MLCLFLPVDAACDVSGLAACVSKLGPMPSSADKIKFCPYFQQTMACYSVDCCNDAQYKPSIDDSVKSVKNSLAAMNVTCNIHCGPPKTSDSSSTGPSFLIANTLILIAAAVASKF